MATTATAVNPALREKLIDYLQDCHALEQNVLRMVEALSAVTADEEVKARLRQHHHETLRHRKIVA
jgi:ferritin-like metal-binding protein YciE